jgi:hypothetical protein
MPAIDQELPGPPNRELSAGRWDLRETRGSGKISTKSAEIQGQARVQIVTCFSHQDQRIIHYPASVRFCHEKYLRPVGLCPLVQAEANAGVELLGPRPCT